jgi:UTP--glucose-1-phosphate uridylyltransferase
LLREFEVRFPAGPPSLVDADRFVVGGDIVFGAGCVVRGDADLDAGLG